MSKYFTLWAIGILLLVSACQPKNTNESTSQNASEEKTAEPILPELPEGDLNLREDAFGKIQELQGTAKPVEEIFKVSETQMLIRDSLLVVKNLCDGKWVMIYQLPEFRLVKKLGTKGNGPEELAFPKLIETQNPEAICYVFDLMRKAYYRLTPDLQLQSFKTGIKSGKDFFDSKQISAKSENEMLFVETSSRGKELFRYLKTPDSLYQESLLDLSFSDRQNNWARFIGDFGVNWEKKRAVFAYKYDKQLLFYDYEKDQVRHIRFDAQKAEEGDPLQVMAPTNVTHYWGMSARDKYVYVAWSGRSPVDVQEEWNQGMHYIYIEQFDWNGNPIRKYKLDRWGYFTVDEKEEILYLTSTNDDPPFFAYRLPTLE